MRVLWRRSGACAVRRWRALVTQELAVATCTNRRRSGACGRKSKREGQRGQSGMQIAGTSVPLAASRSKGLLKSRTSHRRTLVRVARRTCFAVSGCERQRATAVLTALRVRTVATA
jgi:hypothetical protein